MAYTEDQINDLRTKVAFEMGSAQALYQFASMLQQQELNGRVEPGFGQKVAASLQPMHIQMLQDLRDNGVQTG